MDLTSYSDNNLHDLTASIEAEWERRRAKAQADQAVTEVVTNLQAEGKIPAPEAGTDAATAKLWANPGTLHDKMYHRGDVVTHGGKTWISRHPFLNHWEPGAVGIDQRIWQEIDAPADEVVPPEGGDVIDPSAPGPDAPAWKAGVNYKVGDLVTYNGAGYEVIQAHTSAAHWPPNQVASLYKLAP